MRFHLSVIAAVLLSIGLFGCSSDTDSLDEVENVDHGRPEAPVGTVREAMFDWLEAMEACMRNSGWELEIDYLQYGFSGMPGEQFDQYDADLKTCEEKIGSSPNDYPMTPELVGRLYDHLVEMKACLEGFGFDISDPPSKAKFIDQYKQISEDSFPWTPFIDIPSGLPDKKMKEIFTKCPQDMDDKLKYEK